MLLGLGEALHPLDGVVTRASWPGVTSASSHVEQSMKSDAFHLGPSFHFRCDDWEVVCVDVVNDDLGRPKTASLRHVRSFSLQ